MQWLQRVNLRRVLLLSLAWAFAWAVWLEFKPKPPRPYDPEVIPQWGQMPPGSVEGASGPVTFTPIPNLPQFQPDPNALGR